MVWICGPNEVFLFLCISLVLIMLIDMSLYNAGASRPIRIFTPISLTICTTIFSFFLLSPASHTIQATCKLRFFPSSIFMTRRDAYGLRSLGVVFL